MLQFVIVSDQAKPWVNYAIDIRSLLPEIMALPKSKFMKKAKGSNYV